jgi:enterobacteria phage integrase
MITSILGHTTLAEAARYTKDADQAALAEDAVIKLERHKAQFARFGKNRENERKIKLRRKELALPR